MNKQRRSILKGSLALSAAGIAASAGLLSPRSVMAAWNKPAFEATDSASAISTMFGSDSVADSADITLKAPDIAENGAVVPVTVTSSIANTESISLIVNNNPTPLTASFDVTNAEAYVSTRIKMGKTSEVTAIVKAGGKLYSAKKEVKVTIGGCGG